MDLQPLQWVGIALLAAGIVAMFGRQAIATVKSCFPKSKPVLVSAATEPLMDRMACLAALQTYLEQRGHRDEAEMAGGWYALLRDPLSEEAPQP